MTNFSNGVLSAANQAVTLDVASGRDVAVQLTDTWVGTVTFEVSVDGRTFVSLELAASDDSATLATSATANGVWLGSCGGSYIVRARMSAYTSGQAKVTVGAA